MELIHADGSGASELLSAPSDTWFTDLAWSPDGTRVAFARYELFPGPGASYGPGALFMMRANGTAMRKIIACQGAACPHNLSWSPDGTRLLYAGENNLVVMGVDGANVRHVYTCRGHDCQWPQGSASWSPDGRRIVFAGMDQNYVGGLFVIGAGGGRPRLISRCYSQLCAGGAREANPAWSPDGGLIAFTRERNIFLIRADGTDLRQISRCPKSYVAVPCNADDPAWSADGAKLAYTLEDEIHVVDRDGTHDHVVVKAPDAAANVTHSYCCLSCKPVPGVRPVTTLPSVGVSSSIRVGAPPQPPRNVGASISPADWAQFRDAAAHTASNRAKGSISPGTVGRLHQIWISSVTDETSYGQSPAVADGQVFVGGYDGNLYAFNARGCGADSCRPEWAGRTGGSVRDSPAVAGGKVFVGSGTGTYGPASRGGLYVFNASGCGRASCAPLWIGRTAGTVDFSSPTVMGGFVYVGTSESDSRLYAFRTAGCRAAVCAPAWIGTGIGNGIASTPAVANGTVYVHGMDRYLYAFRASGCGTVLCSPLWKGSTDTVTEDESSPSVSGGHVYVGGGDCEQGDCGLWVFRAGECGQAVCPPSWVDLTAGGVASSPAIAMGVVYVTDGGGRLLAFRRQRMRRPALLHTPVDLASGRSG